MPGGHSTFSPPRKEALHAHSTACQPSRASDRTQFSSANAGSAIPRFNAGHKRTRTETYGDGPLTSSPARSVQTNVSDLGASYLNSPRTEKSPLLQNTRQLSAGSHYTYKAEHDESEHATHNVESDKTQIWDDLSVDAESASVSQSSANSNATSLALAKAVRSGPTWSQYAYGIIGGLVGEVWNFCLTTAFTGFKAGGGPIHSSAMSESASPDEEPTTLTRTPFTFHAQYARDQILTTPGTSEEQLDVRASKRLQTSHQGDWVFIRNAQTSDEQISPPQARSPRVHSQGSAIPRPISNRGTPAQQTVQLKNQSTITPQTSPSRSHSSRAASVARVRSPAAVSALRVQSLEATGSPTQRQRRELPDWHNDVSMRRVNEQLKAMIREGKEALAK